MDEHDLPIVLVYRDGDAGFVFALKKADLEEAGGQLPSGFVDVTAQKGRWVFSSIELVRDAFLVSHPAHVNTYISQKKRNARMKDALDETLILSDKYVPRPYLLVAYLQRHFGGGGSLRSRIKRIH